MTRVVTDGPRSLTDGDGRAVLWGIATDDLNVNLVAWPAGDGVDSHTNGERDVLIVVVDGSAVVTVDGEDLAARAGECLMIAKGAERSIRAGADGVRYMTVHRRREGLDITRAGERPRGGIPRHP